MKTNEEYIKSGKERVCRINSIFETLHLWPADSLRNRIKEIESIIHSCTNIERTLDELLEEVFAILKETTRRFSIGDIIVTANENDHSLEKIYDFVDIKGNKAIYHNTWDAYGTQIKWNMVFYDEQLLGGIFLHKGLAVQMATGEGKTLVGTLPTFLNALTHKGVHVITVNDYLSKRDCDINRPLFSFYGLSVDCIEDRITQSKKKIYQGDIVFGTNSSFTFDYLRDHLAMSINDCVQREHYYAIIDEMDSVLIDNASTPHIIGGGFMYNDGPEYIKYNPLIKEFLEFARLSNNPTTNEEQQKEDGKLDESFIKIDVYNKEVSLGQEGKKWFADKLKMKDLFRYNKSYEINGYSDMNKEQQKSFIVLFHIQNIINQLITAYTAYQKDVDYIVSNAISGKQKKIVIIDQNTGRPLPSNRWEYGLHTAVEVKEGVKPELDSNSIAVISLKNYFKLYTKVAGMSGTIISVADELLRDFGLSSVALPTHKPVQRIDEPLRIFINEEKKNKAIIDEIIKVHNTNRPILVSSPSMVKSNTFCKLLKEKGIPFCKLDATTLKTEAHIISHAGEKASITISTSVAGRGTDIKLSEESNANGGLAVIGTELFDSSRIDNQIKGRAGRQGDNGSSVFFASLEDDIVKNLTDEDRNKLTTILHNQELDKNFEYARDLFTKAQSIREQNNAIKRQRSNNKDDTIAPYRLKFYEERNKLLYDSEIVSNIIERMCVETVTDIKGINKHLQSLFPKVQYLVNTDKKVITFIHDILPIPCVHGNKLFVIDIKLETSDNIDTFISDAKRQIVLLHYDEYWRRFVLHLNDNLDKKEQEELPEEFESMVKRISETTINCLCNFSIPIRNKEDKSPNGQKKKNANVSYAKETTKECSPSSDMLCPCGSGKKFCECHGKHGIRKRRR